MADVEQGQAFETWAVVELFGHQKIAGRVTEQQILGTVFLRVEVPETRRQESYVRLLGAGAIYGILPCTESYVRAYLEEPYSTIAHPSFARKALPAVSTGEPEDAVIGQSEDDYPF